MAFCKDSDSIGCRFVNWLTKFFIVFGGIIPYSVQYFQIYKTNNSGGFSTWLCLFILASNVSRLAYWYQVRFEAALAVQSLVMIIMMGLLLELCIRLRRRRINLQEVDLWPDFWSNFWQWTRFSSYVLVIVAYGIINIGIILFLGDYAWITSSLGLCSAILEAFLGVPQLLNNFLLQQFGMSWIMVAAMLIGDSCKMGFNVISGVPWPFYVSSIILLTVDIALLIQMFLYRNNENNRNRDEDHQD